MARANPREVVITPMLATTTKHPMVTIASCCPDIGAPFPLPSTLLRPGARALSCPVRRSFTATRQLSLTTSSVAYGRLTRDIPVCLSRKNAR